jgi:hypothetical protein
VRRGAGHHRSFVAGCRCRVVYFILHCIQYCTHISGGINLPEPNPEHLKAVIKAITMRSPFVLHFVPPHRAVIFTNKFALNLAADTYRYRGPVSAI